MPVYKKLLDLIYSVSVLNSDNNHMIVGKFIKDPSHVSIYFAATREILTYLTPLHKALWRQHQNVSNLFSVKETSHVSGKKVSINNGGHDASFVRWVGSFQLFQVGRRAQADGRGGRARGWARRSKRRWALVNKGRHVNLCCLTAIDDRGFFKMTTQPLPLEWQTALLLPCCLNCRTPPARVAT